jgi:hypothetical protein
MCDDYTSADRVSRFVVYLGTFIDPILRTKRDMRATVLDIGSQVEHQDSDDTIRWGQVSLVQ